MANYDQLRGAVCRLEHEHIRQPLVVKPRRCDGLSRRQVKQQARQHALKAAGDDSRTPGRSDNQVGAPLPDEDGGRHAAGD